MFGKFVSDIFMSETPNLHDPYIYYVALYFWDHIIYIEGNRSREGKKEIYMYIRSFNFVFYFN